MNERTINHSTMMSTRMTTIESTRDSRLSVTSERTMCPIHRASFDSWQPVVRTRASVQPHSLRQFAQMLSSVCLLHHWSLCRLPRPIESSQPRPHSPRPLFPLHLLLHRPRLWCPPPLLRPRLHLTLPLHPPRPGTRPPPRSSRLSLPSLLPHHLLASPLTLICWSATIRCCAPTSVPATDAGTSSRETRSSSP